MYRPFSKADEELELPKKEESIRECMEALKISRSSRGSPVRRLWTNHKPALLASSVSKPSTNEKPALTAGGRVRRKAAELSSESVGRGSLKKTEVVVKNQPAQKESVKKKSEGRKLSRTILCQEYLYRGEPF